MVFTNIKIPRAEFPQKGSNFYAKTLIKKSVSIGANATILCGITIGEYALIGAGAVITKDVPSYALVLGNPGIIIGWVDQEGNKLEFELSGMSLCKEYRLDHNTVTKL